MNHTEKQDVTYYNGHVIEINGKRYVPERTCRNLACDDDVFICSECRNETHGFMVDKFGCTVGFGKVVCKCPNCGARVIE